MQKQRIRQFVRFGRTERVLWLSCCGQQPPRPVPTTLLYAIPPCLVDKAATPRLVAENVAGILAPARTTKTCCTVFSSGLRQCERQHENSMLFLLTQPMPQLTIQHLQLTVRPWSIANNTTKKFTATPPPPKKTRNEVCFKANPPPYPPPQFPSPPPQSEIKRSAMLTRRPTRTSTVGGEKQKKLVSSKAEHRPSDDLSGSTTASKHLGIDTYLFPDKQEIRANSYDTVRLHCRCQRRTP